jgi:predicted N-acyltransferase
VASLWDALIPRDWPHLRVGFLQAVEQSRMLEAPAYLVLRRGEQTVAVAVTYTVRVDSSRDMAPWMQPWVQRVRKVLPNFLRQPMRVCGSPVSNSASGIYLAPQLSAAEQHQVFQRLVQEFEKVTPHNHTLYFKEFTDEELAAYAGDLEAAGYFAVKPGMNMRLDLPWSSFEGYINAMQKRYRKLIRKDLKMSEGLDFQLLDDFQALAATAYDLYDRVFAQADYIVEKANAEFFAALSRFEQAKLLVAREKSSGELLGVNLLLFGETLMQNLFIGFNYEKNNQYHLYFSLPDHSLRCAIEHGCKVCFLGQDSYEYKARLGAKPVPLTAFMKHRRAFVHRMLLAHKDDFFPGEECVTHNVFKEGSPDAAEED